MIAAVAAIEAETDPERRAALVGDLTHADRVAIKNQMHAAEDPIRRNLLMGILELADIGDRIRAAAALQQQQQQHAEDGRRAKAERLDECAYSG